MSIAYALPQRSDTWQDGYALVTETLAAIRASIVEKDMPTSASDWLPTVREQLRDIGRDCARSNWDGEGAEAILPETIGLASQIASSLFRMLPKGAPAPDVYPDNDGDIGFDWTMDSTRMFWLSIAPSRKMNFAGKFGAQGGVHGWRPIGRNVEVALAEVVQSLVKLFDGANGTERCSV